MASGMAEELYLVITKPGLGKSKSHCALTHGLFGASSQ